MENFQNEFKYIKNIYNENENNKNKINNIIKNNYSSNNSQIIDDIISNLNEQRIKDFDQKLKKDNIKSIISDINNETLYWIDKSINIYKDFILVYQNVYDYIKNNFDNSINLQNIYYTSHKSGDIITIETSVQHTILIGKLNTEQNFFEIKYILEFNSNKSFENERNIIIEGGDIDNYIETKMIFDKNNKNDYISPIFSKNEFIGYCYIYKQNIKYKDCINYYEFLSYEKIIIL